ncbi:hypothetical protein IU433_17890 [Nocardia puris]|uniref:hypothetical protein n=1 Tax=Nocardia puris TaxID=208602 RepID=UPI0018961FB5|nr:hypothetical protein [Nocardia puris]MBF6212316.1 hypothetical protein [Nocardia puris]MBF6366563.1 hypothetical protein [Nocardia puris]MBF6460905.1 hypothetical protein [Nocardia puris]
MGDVTPEYRELVAATFAGDYADGAVDHDALRRIHAGAFDPWLSVLDRSGLFDAHALANLAERWRADPRVLIDALLADADDVTRRRWLSAWSALNQPSESAKDYA